MELINGYYQDAEKRTYKVTDDQLFVYDIEKGIFEPLLSYQEFVLQFLNNLLVKKNIVELASNYSDIVYLVYPNMDCPTEDEAKDALRYGFANHEIEVSEPKGWFEEKQDEFSNFVKNIEEQTEKCFLPLTPQQSLDEIDKEIEFLECEINRLCNDKYNLESELENVGDSLSILLYKKEKLESELL